MMSQASHAFGPDEQLRQAKLHMAELRDEWHKVNGHRSEPGELATATVAGRRWNRSRRARVRIAIGRAFIGLGRAVAGLEVV